MENTGHPKRAGTDGFGDPCLVDEVTDLRGDAHEIGRLKADTLGILGVNPHRIRVR